MSGKTFEMLLATLFAVATIYFQDRLLAQQIVTSADHVAFQLRLTPDLIEESITKNVTLECANYGPITSKVARVVFLSILKRQVGNSWKTIAEITESDSNVRTHENVLATGNIGNNRTFLQIVWLVANNDTFGQYRCDVLGYDDNSDNIDEQSPTLMIVRHNITAREVLMLLLQEEEYNQQKLAWQMQEQSDRFLEIMKLLNQTQSLYYSITDQLNKFIPIQSDFRNRTETALESLENELGRKIVPLIQDINVIFSDLNSIANISHTSLAATTIPTTTVPTTLSPLRGEYCKNKTLENAADGSSWPEGTFGLLMPDSGCPGNTKCTEWETSFYKFYTEMDNNHNEVANYSHLATPVQERGENNKTYMYQRFCVVTQEYPNLPWPNGTYCINRGIKPCPAEFEEGWIHFDEEDTDHGATIVGGVPPYRYYVGNIYYCCRADGSHDTPMVLPTSLPFYLYRYQNKCQKVDGMEDVTEFMLFDTENDNNKDNADQTNYHPDASLNDVNITLCYYHRNSS